MRLYDVYSPRDWLWLVSYSGGKDSTALLLLVLRFACEKGFRVGVVYNDCGGDLPEVRALVYRVLDALRAHSVLRNCVSEVYVTKPEKSFFDYLLTKYSPPRWSFRWCCKRLKEYPFKRLAKELSKSYRVLNLVGSRSEEARWRSWSVKVVSERLVYAAPLHKLKREDVWRLLRGLSSELGLEWVYSKLLEVYRGGAVSRSGCWFCTVAGPSSLLLLDRDLLKLKLEVLEAWCSGLRERIAELSKEYPELVKVSVSTITHSYPCGRKCEKCQVKLVRDSIKKLLNLLNTRGGEGNESL